MEDKKLILKVHFIGTLFIVLVGSMLHFLFEWSGYFYPTGAIAAVNESVWEHLKLGFWPVIFFAPLEYLFLKELLAERNFITARMIAAYTIPISIVVMFYSYTAIIGTNMLILDILTFIIAVVIGQIASYKLMLLKQLPKYSQFISLILLVFLAIIFVLFTFLPPNLPIFRDSLTGSYGITNQH